MSGAFEASETRGTEAWVPLLGNVAPTRIVAWRDDGAVDARAFLRDVAALAARLPEAPAAVNLCEDRYAFTVAFAALLVRGQANLLPPSRAAATVVGVLAAHPGSYVVGDAAGTVVPARYVRYRPGAATRAIPAPLLVKPDALAAVGYTSGSTGVPRPNPKRWDKLAISTARIDHMLRGLTGGDYHVAATVPPQHMYGLELSVLLPLFGFAAVHAGRPFFAADIGGALAVLPEPRVLVTTPVHLRSLLEARQRLPRCAAVFSSTAPLDRGLARAAEARFGAPVLEGFGSTETCMIASRRTAHEDAWTLGAGIALHPQPDGTRVEGEQLAAPVTLADIVEPLPGGRFRLRGRNTDLLDIAGKRASLGDLTHKLLAVPGVVDGVVLQLDAPDAMGVRRTAALAVAPGLDAAAILAELRRHVDPVFLPRPLKLVPALPRTATGKLPRAAALALLGQAADDAAGRS